MEARKKASIDAPEIQEPTTPRTKVDVQVEIKPRIESMEKKSRGEEEQTVKKTVDIKDQLHLDIKPKIEFMEKISSPRNNNEYTSPRNNNEHVSPRNNETSPSKSNKELIQLADGKAEIKEIKDIVPSQEIGVPNEVNEIDNKEEELLKQHKEQEEEQELKRKEIEIELKRKQEEEEEIRKQKEIELKKQEQQKKEQHELELKRKQEKEEEQQQQQELKRKEEQRKQEEGELRKKKEEEELRRKEEEIEINKKREKEELNKKKLQQQQEENNKKEQEELKKREDEIKRKQIEDENSRKQKEKEQEEKRKNQEQKEQQERKRKEEEEEINKKKREEEEIRIKKRREEEEKVKREIKEIQNKSIEQIEQTYLKRKEMEEINKKKELNKFNMNTEEKGEYYNEMTQLAREWSVTMTTPTFVLIGGQGHGKSTLIECIIGIPSITSDLSINVPIIFELIPDINATDVLYSVFDIDSNTILSLNSIKDLQTWILNTQNKMNKTDITNVPSLHIYIKFNKFGFPIKFIDTPPLYNSSSKKENIKNELIIMDFIKDKNNTIIYVEDCNTYNNNNDNNTLINGVDPQYERTIKIITKIDTSLIKNQQSIINLIDNISNKKKINNIFVVSLLDTNDRNSCKTIDDFRSKLGEKQVIDYKIIEKYDKSKQIENNYGIGNIRKEILNKAWNKNKIVVPQIKREIIDKMKVLKEKQKYYIEQNKIMNNTKQMRVFTFKYINQYLNTLEKIVEGSEKIRIPLQGQTTKEEIMEQSNTWDINISIITINKIKEIQEEIPFSNSRLHGAQQLKRLISEFQNIIETIKLPKDNEDIIITAAGLNHLHSSNNYAYAACEIATEHSNQLLKPLVFELANRSSYIIKRSCIAAQSIISEHSSFNSLPVLSNYVSQLFQSFIDKMTLLFLQQIQSEFFDAKTLYWFTTTKKHRFISQGEELVDFTNELFQSIKEHIAHKSLLLITNYLIFSILDRSHGLDEMLLHINSVSDQELSELFQGNYEQIMFFFNYFL